MARKGFTLIEVLLSVVLISAVSVIIFPVYLNFQTRNDLTLSASTITQAIRQAQLLAIASQNDSTWGAKISTSTVTVFQGLSYASRNLDSDQVVDFSHGLTNSGINEIVFKKLSGETTNIGDIIITSTDNGTKTININSQGKLEY